MQRFIPVTIILFALSSAAGLGAQTISVTRAFVNGTGDHVTDLHIQYNKDITGRAQILGQAPRGTRVQLDRGVRSRVNVFFPDPGLPAGSQITVRVTVAGSELGIRKWFWTAGGKPGDDSSPPDIGERVGRERGGTERGDEADGVTPPEEDLFSLVNKNHHWGGAKRGTEEIEIKIHIKKLLDKVPSGQDPDDYEAAILAAIRQWTDCTRPATARGVPKAGEGGNPTNDGTGPNPPVMAPGETHPEGLKGKKFRSVTRAECDAIRLKYPEGLKITVTKNIKEADIIVKWAKKDMPRGAAGHAQSVPKDSDGQATGGALVRMRGPKIRKSGWHTPTDTDGNGYITNGDTDDVPDDFFDFYSVFKHELGHVLCFEHTGSPGFLKELRSRQARLVDEKSDTAARSPAPVPTGDGEFVRRDRLYFAAERKGGRGGMDIWILEPTREGFTVRNAGPGINTAADETDPFLTPDGGRIFFSSNRKGGAGGYDLYVARLNLETEAPGRVRNLGEGVNSSADERRPTLSMDMHSLYFASNRKGGFGGWDLWSSENSHGEVAFSPPDNLGSHVNSKFDETTPAISATGDVLVFSSNRPGGVGGYDLYFSRAKVGWRPAKNLGKKANSPADDLDPVLRYDHHFFYFSSNRAGVKEKVGKFRLYEIPLLTKELRAKQKRLREKRRERE